jgi:hypothetical protein
MAFPFSSQQPPTYQQRQSGGEAALPHQDIYNITTSGSASSTLLEKLTIEDLQELEVSLIEELTGYTKGTRDVQGDVKTLKKFTKKRDDWVPIFPLSTQRRLDADGIELAQTSEAELYALGHYPILGNMPLQHGIYIAKQVKHMLDPASRTTYFDPLTTDTVEISRIIALATIFLLDNPKYEYTGNESDMSMFGLFVVKKLHVLLNSAVGGFFMSKATESTTNIYRKDISDQSTMGRNALINRRESGIQKFLGRLK